MDSFIHVWMPQVRPISGKKEKIMIIHWEVVSVFKCSNQPMLVDILDNGLMII